MPELSAIEIPELFPSEEPCLDIISGTQVHPRDKVTDLSANIMITKWDLEICLNYVLLWLCN